MSYEDKTVLSEWWVGQGWGTGDIISEHTPNVWKKTVHYASGSIGTKKQFDFSSL